MPSLILAVPLLLLEKLGTCTVGSCCQDGIHNNREYFIRLESNNAMKAHGKYALDVYATILKVIQHKIS